MRQGIIVFGCVLLAGVFGFWFMAARGLPELSKGKALSLKLKRDSFTVYAYAPEAKIPRALIVFASGDGGWGRLEEAIATRLSSDGYGVLGIDSESYAATDYNLDTLQADFTAMASLARDTFGHGAPLIVGGYSMGAAQAIAVCGGPHPPKGVAGLLLVDPCSRGRYGLRIADQMNVLPTGPGTFAVKDFARTLGDIRVVQWHAERDNIDSRQWLASLTVPHEEFDFPRAGHDYVRGRKKFLVKLSVSVGWILNGKPGAAMAAMKEKGS